MMKEVLLSLSLIALVFCAVSTVNAADDSMGAYIKVEIRGTLEGGMMAKGGETTGTVIHANNVTWELDLKADQSLSDLAKTLDKKTVIVTGSYEKITGMAIKERSIVRVDTLKAAE